MTKTPTNPEGPASRAVEAPTTSDSTQQSLTEKQDPTRPVEPPDATPAAKDDVAEKDQAPRLDEDKQGKHVPGHPNFDARGRSELTADPNELAARAGTGQQVGSIPRGEPGFKERVDFGQEIGIHVDQGGNRSPTTVGILHYAADNNFHIVPARPIG